MSDCPKGQSLNLVTSFGSTYTTSFGSTYTTTWHQISKYIQAFCVHLCNQKEKGSYRNLRSQKKQRRITLIFYEPALELSVYYSCLCFICIMNDLQNYSEVFMTETQNGFRKGQSCTDPTFCLKLLIEKRREFNLETHLLL